MSRILSQIGIKLYKESLIKISLGLGILNSRVTNVYCQEFGIPKKKGQTLSYIYVLSLQHNTKK